MALRLFPSVPSWTPRLILARSRYLQSVPIALPVTISLTIPSLLSNLWDSVLRAVPKKKTSYSKKRHRQMAGKALKDVTGLTKCPGCGQLKRAHHLCPHCVKEIKESWQSKKQTA